MVQTLELGEETVSSLARSEQKRLAKIVTPGIIHSVLHHLISRTLRIFIRSGDLSKVQTAALSVDWVAAQFSSMLPESFAGQNLRRAASLIGTKQHDQERTLLYMLIYLASNHVILDDVDRTKCNLAIAEALVLLFRLVDLGSPHMLQNLIQFSRESATLAAVVEELFQAAIMTGALDLVANILNKNPLFMALGVQTNVGRIPKLPPLHWAVLKGSADLVNLLLKLRADVNELNRWQSNSEGWTPLALAACHGSHKVSSNIANILLQNGAKPNPGTGYAPLPLCLCHGNFQLALELIALGAADCPFESMHVTKFETLSSVEFYHGSFCATLTRRVPLLSSISLFGFAACACNPRNNAYDLHDSDEVVENADEQVVLRLFEALQNTAKPHCGSDVMILAASRGHLKVMSYLRAKFGQAVDSVNGSLSPLYAAVLWNHMDAARQLLEWGASASIDERLRDSWVRSQMGLPTPLHIAVQFGSSDMVKLLIHHNGKIDQSSKFFTDIHSERWMPSNWMPVEEHKILCSWRSWTLRTRTCSPAMRPLDFAVRQKRWGQAETLLSLGAKPSKNILFEAAEQGQSELVVRLLEHGIRPDLFNERGLTALEVAAAQGHTQVVSHLLQAGAPILNTSFAALFCLPDVSTIRTLLRRCSDKPMLLDKGTNRSYLENAILGGFKEVVDLALEVDEDYYDSGALCAATLDGIYDNSPDTQLLLHELVRRRESPFCTKSRIQLSLESTAISIAAFYDRLDIIDIISQSRIPGRHRALAVRVDSSVGERVWEARLACEELNWDDWHVHQVRGASPLEYAAIGKSAGAFLRLLQEGYRPETGSVNAAINCLGDDMVEMVTERCEDINMIHPYYNHYTPLQIAVRKGDRNLVKGLLAKGADPNMYERRQGDFPTRWGLPALTIAVQVGDLDLVSLLLENGADVDKGHSSGAEYTALQLAVAKGYINIVNCLIHHNADLHARRYPVFGLGNAGHGTPLEEAARWGRLDILHLLLDSGVSTTGYHRLQYVTSIIYAQQSGHQAIAQALYDHRSWSPEDQAIYQELAEFPPDRTFFFHSTECPEGELPQFAAENVCCLYKHRPGWRWWKEKPLVLGISPFDENLDTESEGPTDESVSSEEEDIETIDDISPAEPETGITNFRNEFIATFDNNEEYGRLEHYFTSSQAEDLMNADYSCIYWPYRNISERPEGHEVGIPSHQTSQHSFDTEQYSMEQSLALYAVNETMDTLDHCLWPYNVMEWSEDNGINDSIDLEDQDLQMTFPEWQQDAEEIMERGGDMFEHSGWY
jgi:ankyrin repeat protein